VVGVIPTSAAKDKHRSTPAQITIPIGSASSPVKSPQRQGTDDNYTTLHRTQQSRLSDPGYKTVRSHPLAVSVPHLSKAEGKETPVLFSVRCSVA